MRSGNGDESSFTALGVLTCYENSFLVVNGYIWVIVSVAPDGGATQIQCADAATIFDRQLVYTGSSSHEFGFIRAAITNNYISCPDPMYVVPYVKVLSVGSPPGGFMRPDLDNGLYRLSDYFGRVRRLKDISVSMSYNNTELIVTMSTVAGSRQIDFAASSDILISETYQEDAVAKITMMQEDEGRYSYTDYYLLTDGTITTDAAAPNRAAGSWIYMRGKDESDVRDRFARNTYAHQIVFRSAKTYDWGTGVKMRMPDGRIITSRITAIMDDGGDMLTYTAGEARVTLTEILQGVTR